MRRLVLLALTALLTTALVAPTAAQDATPDADGYIYGTVAGNAFELLDDPEDGEVSVVAFGPSTVEEYGDIAFVIINGTDDVVGQIEVSARVRDENDDLIGSIETGIVQPQELAPGEIGLVLGDYSGDVADLADATIEPRVSSDDGSDFVFLASPPIVELNQTDDGIVGIAENTLDGELGLLTFDIVCFDEDGAITQAGTTIADSSSLTAGADTTFTFGGYDLDASVPCDYFLVAGNGFFTEN